MLLRGVDSLERDDEVEVIYGNTPDRPMVDSKGQFLAGASFTISTKPPRHRNVLRGRIVGGVLTTEPADIKLTQTWGQGGARDIRGNRSGLDPQARPAPADLPARRQPARPGRRLPADVRADPGAGDGRRRLGDRRRDRLRRAVARR